MNRKTIFIIILVVVISVLFLLRRGSDEIVSPQAGSQAQEILILTPSPTPTPLPKSFDKNSNLEAETENVTPEDFSGDFKILKEETSKL